MLRRSTLLLTALALVAAGCSYESSGTTTTTVVAPEDLPPSTGPADLVLEDQRVEGTTMAIDSVTMPDAGWVVVRVDQGGGPGEIIGISEILRKGVIARVPIPFFVPLTEATVVHATVHVDIDRDGVFTYEAPDSLVDEIATFANGDAATTSAMIRLLPPIQPGEATLEEQRTDGYSVIGAAAVLPAPGFVALMSNVQGEPGDILDATDLLPAGTVADIELLPEPPLRISGLVFLVAWVDRDEDGLLDPANDDIAVRADGTLAADSAVVTVIALEPTVITVEDQSGDGTLVRIPSVELPAPGFIELLADADGVPGERIAITGLRVEGLSDEITFELEDDAALEGEAEEEITLWVRVVIDFDEDAAATDLDPFGLVARGGEVAAASFVYTFEEE
jgi:hypothetical protein